MPPTRSIPAAIQHSPPRSDENYVVTAIGVFLLASLILGTATYKYLQHSEQQAQTRNDRQAYKRYNDYLKSAQEDTPAPAAQGPSPAQAAQASQAAPAQPSMAEKLLSHPSVTPGPGFNAPGVQQTGVAIIDAMEHAQATAKQ
ncbi:hypothetical protein [Comamonas sp. 26]|uniref:hypothetical protein n=1 Tax=Comamonas sp. 26 TaxID=2035201 RepID=UPI000C40C35E|nr:hypothetical protein [Comamonas sp. 26]PIG09279.1 hypothetical protein CLU84_2178 [Comamonas sp. 26]